MKKLIAILLIFAICCSLSITAFAEEIELTEDNPTGECTIEFYVPSSYCVIIPETIFCYQDYNYLFEATKMNIRDDEEVNVYYKMDSHSIPLKNSSGDTLDLFLHGWGEDKGCVASFKNKQSTSRFYVSFSTYWNEEYDAGEYTGTIEFTVCLEPLGTI